jgi:hypothetical protein
MDSVDIAGGSITGVTTLADLGNAVPLTFSTTTTDSDPGSGTIRLDNATQNAATTFYVDDADSNAAAIATFVQSLSGGNNPSATLGFVTLRKQFAPEIFATYKVTAVVNASGYTKLTVANLSSSATNPFSDADGVLLSIDLAGDKGDAGEMEGPGSSTDNAVARFSGTGGATVQNSAVIIDDSNNITGVASLTLTTDLAVAHGGTGSSSASAARTALGVAIGSDVQAYDAQLADLAGLALTNSNFIVGDGTNWVAESGATARTSLGVGSISTQASDSVSITGGSISGITDLAIADGGTGSGSASAARTALGVAIGSDIQAYDADLAAIAALAKTDSNFIVGNGSAWVAETGATVRTSLGLGSMATQAHGSVNIDGGSITGITDLAVADGGTGQGSYTNGQLLIGNTTGNTLAKATITAGTGMTVTNGAGAITIATTAATTGKAIAMAIVFG